MPKSKNPRKTWRYSADFKVKAVELSYQEGIQVQQVADGLDIHPFMLSRWRKEYREGKIRSDGRKRVSVMKDKKAPTPKELSELGRLKRENARLHKENALLKKWQRYLAARHQSDLDSSKPTGESSASDTSVNGCKSPAAGTTPGCDAPKASAPKRTGS